MRRVAIAALLLAACHRGAIVPDERPAPRADAGAEGGIAPTASAAPADAGVKEPVAIGGPFVVVARGTELTLERVTGSPVLAVDHASNVLWELRPDGEAHLVEAFAETSITRERSMVLRAGRIAGRWPLVQIELGWGGGRESSTIHNWLVDVAKGTVKPVSVPLGHLASTSPWNEGVELGLAAEETSLMASGFMPRHLALAAFGEPKKPVPKLPSAMVSKNPSVAAYDTGRVFVLAGEQGKVPDSYEVDDAMVWTIAPGKPASLRVPGHATRLLRGRTETETLVAGDVGDSDDAAPFLARWDGSAFVPVSLPFETPLRSVVAADDGTVWAVSGRAQRKDKYEGGTVWRASFPELRFERVSLGASFAPYAIAATSASDVWLVAEHPSLDYGVLLLHTQATAPAKRSELPSSPDDIARILHAKRELPPAGPTCLFPFLALGKDGEVQEADLPALVKADPSVSSPGSTAVLVTAASGDAMWGVELYGSPTAPTKDDLASWKTSLAAAKPRFPGAKLVCGRLPIQREVELVPRRRPTKKPPWSADKDASPP